MRRMSLWLLMFYVVGWCAALALISRLWLKRSVWEHRSEVILYMAFLAMFGPLGEIIVGTLYTAVVGYPLLQYQLYPIHHGYTSLYAPFIWAIGGLQIWVMSPLTSRIKDRVRRFTVMAIDILAVEILINTLFLLIAGQMIFYYIPSDLGHLSSLQTLPFYFIASLVIVRSLRLMRPHKGFAVAACLLVCTVIVYLT